MGAFQVNSSTPSNPYHRTRVGKDYYLEDEDAARQESYYAPVADHFRSDGGKELFQVLHDHLEATHKPLDQLPAEDLYREVDRRPDGALYYLYSGEGPKEEDGITERNNRDLTQYNLEHVVPKSWFEAELPMRDDLHHLFTEQRQCNSDRGNLPFDEVGSGGEKLESCGLIRPTHGKAFEPEHGKGEVARAVLYFVTRYPGLVGDRSREMTTEDIPKLLKWHKEYPVTTYERHRNEVCESKQGNRNPFIDHPELASKVDFSLGFAR